MKWALLVVVVLLGLVSGGWMAADGLRRFVTGDYVRIDGQLGPWQYLFSAMRVDPMGLPVAALFVLCGLTRLAATAGLVFRAHWAWDATLLSTAASLWYLPVGTASALLTIALLFTPALRGLLGR